ncbi:helix-turn-helix domain-containing protein [Geodermatophilus chilensis]|uniref:helix-turn-helix domain-containing protein n=1 Tax=Geodermatophilus chilensis TaxID=2035835 RepID=UPI000C259283|nr:helix-turn-helix domain-containing protein [Geodermatophilus chilensis]
MATARVVGRNVRRLRLGRRLSLGSLAGRAGLAKQTLANLESGEGNPTIETLLAVSRALGVGAASLLTEWGSPVVVRRGADEAWEESTDGRRRRLDDTFGTGQVTAFLVELTGPATARDALAPGTLLHAYVISGRLLAGTVDDQHRLAPGDFIRFPGDVPHVLGATSGVTTVHLVTTVPQVQQFRASSPDPAEDAEREDPAG